MDASQSCRWHEFDSQAGLEHAALRFILQSADQAIAARGTFRIVLAGGNTPRGIYRSLRSAATSWPAWHIYFGDERCLPADSPDRNSTMAAAEWLHHVAIPARQIHIIPAELGAESAAVLYALELADVETFDLVLLGLGEDGHTASLFPGRTWEHAPLLPTVIAVVDAPKPPPQRVTLSPERLSHASRVLYLVSGAEKRQAVVNWRKGVAIPASRIRPPAGADVFISISGDPAI
jgi:6-phosphogluconolactonase